MKLIKKIILLFLIVTAISCQNKEQNNRQMIENSSNNAIAKQNDSIEKNQNSLLDTVKDSDFTIKSIEAMDYKDVPGSNPAEDNLILYEVNFKIFPSEKNLIIFLNKRENDNKYKGKIFPKVAYNIYFKESFKYKIQYVKGKIQSLSDDKGNLKYF